MKSASQVLPSLLFLAFGGAGFLWLAEPAAIGAAQRRSLAPASSLAPPSTGRAAKSGGARAADLRSTSARSALTSAQANSNSNSRQANSTAMQAISAAAAEPIDPERLEHLRQKLEEQKERRRKERQLERERDEEQWLRTRAEQLASELHLPAGSAAPLATVLVQERDLQSAAWNSVRTCGSTQDSRQRLRDEMQSIRAWRTAELTRLFGEDAVRRFDEVEKGSAESER